MNTTAPRIIDPARARLPLTSKKSCNSEPPGFNVAQRIAIIHAETDTGGRRGLVGYSRI